MAAAESARLCGIKGAVDDLVRGDGEGGRLGVTMEARAPSWYWVARTEGRAREGRD